MKTNFFKKEKIDESKPDDIEWQYMLHHVFLLETSRILLTQKDHYDEVYINTAEVIDAIILYRKEISVTTKTFDIIIAHLVVFKYIDIIVISEPPPDKTKYTFFKVTELGVKAILSAEFLKLQVNRRMEVKNLKLIETSIKAHGHQKWINITLIIATILASIMPFLAAWIFTTKVYNTNVLPAPVYRPDIRIDSVWLHQQVDDLIQKRLSNIQPKSTKKTQHPKGAAQ